MNFTRACLAFAFLFAAATLAFAADVVVLKGGARIELQKPWVRQGNQALLTRADGTLLSVPVSEIDPKATAALKAVRAAAKPAPRSTGVIEESQETPAEAARSPHDGRKARIKITDADVSHVEEPAEGEKKEPESRPKGSGRLEVADWSQEKAGGNLIVRGSIRNVGASPAANARMTVTALDEKGQKIGSAEAGLSKGLVEPGASVSFTATIAVGEKLATSIRFAPQWILNPPPAPAAAASSQSAARQPTQPPPTPTPYGFGTLYAPPVASAPTAPPDDSHRGYVPEFTKEGQPKVPQ